MREYKGSEIRNIAVVGHGASGKTSLVDALAFVSGASKRHGAVKEGTSLTDTAPEEIERGYSINLGVAHAEWLGTKINIIDTPGFLDFHGVINLFTKKALLFKHGSKSGEFQEVDIPADYRTQFDRYYQELIESISSTDDTLLERYLEGGEIDREEAIVGMKEAMKRMELFPLFCVSSELNYGVQAVLNTIVELLPNAFEMEEVHAFKGAEGNATV